MDETIYREIAVAVGEGICPVHLHAPADGAPRPGVLLYMDAPGIRPALHSIAARIATAGYAVMMPDLFHPAGRYEPIDVARVFTDPDLRAAHRRRFNATITSRRVMEDTRIILDMLPTWPEVRDGPIGAVGYCMGGRLALIATGTFPDRIAAVASYHAGGLADDRPDSPHLLAPYLRAVVYVAGTSDDPNFPDAIKARLGQALAAADVDHRVETYPARHGWVPHDMPAHDPVEAEHHWATLIPLLDGALKKE